jgi:hypothetical protein
MALAVTCVAVPQASPSHTQLRPVDEAPECAGFAAFRTQLLNVIARRDAAALLQVVDPNVHLTFGDARGRADFRKMWLSGDPEHDLWTQMRQVLELGGRCEQGDAFTAPYVFTDWPRDLAPHEFLAVIGAAIPLREKPDARAPVVAPLDFAIVRLTEFDTFGKTWLAVETPDGKAGFISVRSVRSAIDMRAIFVRKNGTWFITTWIGGD